MWSVFCDDIVFFFILISLSQPMPLISSLSNLVCVHSNTTQSVTGIFIILLIISQNILILISSHSYLARPFNFALFPHPFQSIDKRFVCQASSLQFLAKNNFDFNKFVYKGWLYCLYFHSPCKYNHFYYCRYPTYVQISRRLGEKKRTPHSF